MSNKSENETPETPSPKAVQEWTEAATLAKEVSGQAGNTEKALVIMCRAALDLGLMASAGSRAFLRLPPHKQ
jgi:hypothetical protein